MAENYAAGEAYCKGILDGLYGKVTLLASREYPVALSVAQPRGEDAEKFSRSFEIAFVRNALNAERDHIVSQDARFAIFNIKIGANPSYKVQIWFDEDKIR